MFEKKQTMQALEGLLGLYEKMKLQIHNLFENDSIFNYELSNGMELAFTQSSMVRNFVFFPKYFHVCFFRVAPYPNSWLTTPTF
jgi:hypothetical protein